MGTAPADRLTLFEGADVEMPEIREWAGLESYYATAGQLVDSEELLQSEDGVTDLEELRSVCVKVQQLLADPIANEIQSALGFKDLTDADQMSDLAAAARDLETVLTKLTQQYPHAERDLGMLRQLSADDIPDLTTFVSEFAALKQPIVGFLFTKRKAEALDLQFRKRFAFAASRPPHAHLAVLKRILDTVTVLIAQAQAASQPELRLSLCRSIRVFIPSLNSLGSGLPSTIKTLISSTASRNES